MEDYRNLLDKLRREAGEHALQDGFQSESLRRTILSQLKDMGIPRKAKREISYVLPAGETELLRTEYFHQVRDISGRIAADLISRVTASAPSLLNVTR